MTRTDQPTLFTMATSLLSRPFFSVLFLCLLHRSCIALMVSLELPGESVDVLQTLAFDLRWSSLTTLLKQATQGLFCSRVDSYCFILCSILALSFQHVFITRVAHARALTHHFNGHFPGKPGLAGFSLILSLHSICFLSYHLCGCCEKHIVLWTAHHLVDM